jgi:indolepyruvate ferredoxin oxidoreductase
MLGFAFQKGLVPVGLAALERAIEINGTSVDANKQTFAWGRLAAHDPARVEAAIAPNVVPLEVPKSVEARVVYRADILTRYQDAAYAESYRNLVSRVRDAEMRCMPGSTALWEAAALGLFKLMAIKDEYEVGRLYSDGSFMRQLNAQFQDYDRLEFHLAPPILGRKDSAGKPRKSVFGPRMMSGFKLLAALRRLRGTPLDVFGYSAERRMERRLLAEYEGDIATILGRLSADRLEAAVALASVPALIRGYGHVKEAAAARAVAERARLVERLSAAAEKPLLAAAE